MNSRKKNSVKKIGSCLFFFILLLVSCVPPTEEVFNEVTVDYQDPTLRKILNLQVAQDLDSLLLFASNPNPTYRLFSANAFASFQTEEAYDTLIKLLNDPFIEVKTAAAFAIGQLGLEKGATELLKAFTQQDSIDVNNTFNAAVLEAMGKIGPEPYLEAIATVSTYRPTDTLLVRGQAEAIYQYGLRDMIHSEGDKTMIKFLTGNYPLSVKKSAAQYFYRFEKARFEDAKFQLAKMMKEHPDPDIKMALATAITRTGDPELQPEIFALYSSTSDYRIKCNILRQIDKYPYISVVERVLGELSNQNEKIGLSAANYLYNNGNSYDAPVYLQYVTPGLNPYVQIAVYKAILKNSGTNSGSRNRALAALKDFVSTGTTDTYVKASAILALAEDPRNYQFLIDSYNANQPPVINTRIMEGLVSILKNERFFRFLGGVGGANAKKNIAAFIQNAMQTAKGGLIAAATEAFTDEELKFDEQYNELSFLDEAKTKLVLPNDLETYNALNAAIAKLKGEPEPEAKRSENIKQINWALFDQFSATPKMRITTTKGDIELKLYKEIAPQSVTNVIDLVKTGYYNNKYFHRVVPNFVAQAGCPDGDGYGSLDFTIRSELDNVHYDDEGYIGYASAGPHTESTQWFITHSPTPHLNGKYTLFGKVSNGMDIVHQLSVGDKINRISISN